MCNVFCLCCYWLLQEEWLALALVFVWHFFHAGGVFSTTSEKKGEERRKAAFACHKYKFITKKVAIHTNVIHALIMIALTNLAY